MNMAKYVSPSYERIENPDSKGNFFVRLAYGVVGSYMETKSMTTQEVIEEFLNHNGVKTPREFFEKKFKGDKNKKDKTDKRVETESEKDSEAENDKLTPTGESIVNELENKKVSYNQVKKYSEQPSEQELISRLSGGDLTVGSCSSLAFAYIGNKLGYDVLDFRDGESRKYFSHCFQKIIDLPGVETNKIKVDNECKGALSVLKSLEKDVEYYFVTGRHAAIVKNTDEGVKYLELQSGRPDGNGWQPINKYGSDMDTMQRRFGCRKTTDYFRFGGMRTIIQRTVFTAKVSSFKNSADFKTLLGYINTKENEQKKGSKGYVR